MIDRLRNLARSMARRRASPPALTLSNTPFILARWFVTTTVVVCVLAFAVGLASPGFVEDHSTTAGITIWTTSALIAAVYLIIRSKRKPGPRESLPPL